MRVNIGRGPSCPLCEEKPFSSRLVCEWEDAYVISDAYPVVPGHLLVVLKQHKLAFADLDNQSLRRIQKEIKKLAKKLAPLSRNILAFERGNALENISSNPSVDHAHIHLLPSVSLESYLPRASTRVDIGDFSRCRTEGNYYLYWNIADKYARIGPSCLIPSQYIRKTIAEANSVGRWNWREAEIWHLSAFDNRKIVMDFLR